MKKLILLMCLVAFGMNAQTGTGTKTTFKIGVVPEGNGIDSILVHGSSDKIVKKVAKSSLIGDFINDGSTTMAPSQNAVFDALINKVSKAGNESIAGTKTFTDRVTIIGTNAPSNTNAISPFNIVGGNGGNSTATSGFATAGNASEIKIHGGSGGNALSSSGTNLGGTAGSVYLLGGDGGLALGGTTNFPGNGGNGTLQGGDSYGGVPGFASLKGGNNKTAGSLGGDVYIVPGWGNNSDTNDAYNGTIYLGLSPNAVSVRGNTVVGGTVDDKMHKLQVNGKSIFKDVLTLANSTLQIDDEEANFNITNLSNKVLFEFAGNPVYQLSFSSSALTANRVLNFINASGSPAIVRTTAPTSSTAAGVKGEIYVDATGFYYCYATNLWHKVTGSTF